MLTGGDAIHGLRGTSSGMSDCGSFEVEIGLDSGIKRTMLGRFCGGPVAAAGSPEG
jgi:hypothetical protein